MNQNGKRNQKVLIVGFAMFSMFFGSGNLVFPLLIGTEITTHYIAAFIGLFITAVLVPCLGLLSIILYDGSRQDFFSTIGDKAAFYVTFAILIIWCPLGSIPRCITVSYGGFQNLAPDFPLYAFGIVFCMVTAALIWSHKGVVELLGKILTPFLLLGLFGIVIAGLFLTEATSTEPSENVSTLSAFFKGLIEGYQTMDLLASFFFGATMVQYLRGQMASSSSTKQLAQLSLKASFICMALLALVYIGFVSLGAHLSSILTNTTPNSMLVLAAEYSLGNFAKPIACLTITLACLTTAVILVLLFAEFISEEIPWIKLKWSHAVIVTIVISYLISLFGFSTLRYWNSLSLQMTYPALFALTIANIVRKFLGFNQSKVTFWGTFVVSAFYVLIFQ